MSSSLNPDSNYDGVFYYGTSSSTDNDASTLTVTLPNNLKGKQALLLAYKQLLQFPQEFQGIKWSAFNDYLTDLNWLNVSKIVINHNDLPSLDNGDLETYIETLRDAITNSPEGKSYVIFFPTTARQQVTKALEASED
jgi:hypothetical protein